MALTDQEVHHALINVWIPMLECAGPNTTGSPLGRGFADHLVHTYNRLPAAAEGVVRSVIWGESMQPAGLFLQVIFACLSKPAWSMSSNGPY
jgi:hypothetical protein